MLATMHEACDYGDHCADFYDEIYPTPSRTTLDRLVELARGGRVLDAGCGTGRYVLALASRGHDVHGIDASAAMLAQLRAKPGGDAVGTTLGDFATTNAPGRYALVVCLADTLSLLSGREAQARAIARLATNLDDDGALVVETMHGCNGMPVNVELLTRNGTRRYAPTRCPVDADDLDAWAHAAGLVRAARWRDWRTTPWRGEAGNVVTVWRREVA